MLFYDAILFYKVNIVLEIVKNKQCTKEQACLFLLVHNVPPQCVLYPRLYGPHRQRVCCPPPYIRRRGRERLCPKWHLIPFPL